MPEFDAEWEAEYADYVQQQQQDEHMMALYEEAQDRSETLNLRIEQ